MKRRRFLAWLLVVPLSVAAILWRWRRSRSNRQHSIDLLKTSFAADLKALCAALLPSALGRARTDAVAADFTDWLAKQDANAELSHLGTKLRRADLATRRPGARRFVIDGANYVRQLEQLRTLARSSSLGRVDRVELSVILVSALQGVGAREIPAGPMGANILLDLLSFFYRSPAATDLLHGRRVAALSCRSLDDVGRIPEPA